MKNICTLLLLLVSLSAVAQKDTRTVAFASGKLTMAIPSSLDTMSKENIWIKYHKTPDAVNRFYSSSDLSFSAVFTELMPGKKVTEAAMIQHKEDLVTELQTKFELTENEVLTVNGHKIIVVAFGSDTPSGKIFNRRIMAVADNKLVMVAFNTTDEDLKNRKAQIETAIQSLQIK